MNFNDFFQMFHLIFLADWISKNQWFDNIWSLSVELLEKFKFISNEFPFANDIFLFNKWWGKK